MTAKTKYAYVIRRSDDERPTDRRTLVVGTRTVDSRCRTRTLANGLVREARVNHSYYTGPIECAVWPHADGESVMPYARGDEPPAHAERFAYGDSTSHGVG